MKTFYADWLLFDVIQTCLKKIQGAKYLSLNDVAARGWVNPWIVQLAQERDARN